MSTTIKCIRGKIEDNLSEGIAIFVSELAKYQDALWAVGFKGAPTPNIDIRRTSFSGVERYLACIDNEHERSIKTVNDMRKQLFATLDAFREWGIKTVSLNGIKVREFTDENSRPEEYQRQYVEEYIAQYPDAFDTVCLVDKYGGFKE